jgi:hypothetical protein
MHVTKDVRSFFLREQFNQRYVYFNFSSTLGGSVKSYGKDETLIEGGKRKRAEEKL